MRNTLNLRFIVQATEHVNDEYVADYFEEDANRDGIIQLVLQLICDSTASGIVEFIQTQYLNQDEENLPDAETIGVVINILDANTNETLVQVSIPYSHNLLDLMKSRCSITKCSDVTESEHVYNELAYALSAAGLS
jgi:hypothetical protein